MAELEELMNASRVPANQRLERTVMRHRGDAASAPFHYALASRVIRQRAAAQPQRYAAEAVLMSEPSRVMYVFVALLGLAALLLVSNPEPARHHDAIEALLREERSLLVPAGVEYTVSTRTRYRSYGLISLTEVDSAISSVGFGGRVWVRRPALEPLAGPAPVSL